MTIRTIVVATDFSPAAARAVGRAAALAALHGAMLELVHVMPRGWLPALRAWAAGAIEGDGGEPLVEANLAALARKSAAAHRIEARWRLGSGDPRVMVPEMARELGADLLVVGAHGGHFVRDLFLGSTARVVLALAPCPVLAVRRAPDQPYRYVLAGTDLSAASATAIRAAAALAPDAHLTVCHCFEDPYGASLLYTPRSPEQVERLRAAARVASEQSLQCFLDGLAPLSERFARTLRHGPAVLRLGEEIEALRPDLVVLGSTEKPGFERLLLGSVAEQIAQQAPCDVLLVRRPAEQPGRDGALAA